MTGEQLHSRRESHARLSSVLAAMTDDELRSLLGERKPSRGWGVSGAVDFNGERLFVKRIPVTAVEMENPYSTRNHYGIPAYYSYGVGSAGFGAFRELASHVTTTDWVLKGTAAGFPLMYHFRLLRTPGGWGAMDPQRHEEYARSWNGDGGIARYVLDRSAAENEAVIILEYAPHTMWRWLTDSPGRVDDVIDQVFQSIAMLRANGVVHFDAHFANVVTDGAAHLLTDFGLWLDSQFELSAEERAFLQRHIDYDYGEVLMSAGDTLTWTFFLLPEGEREAIRRELGIHRTDGNAAIGRILIARLEDLAGLMPVEGVLLEAVRRYRPVMLFMSEFLSAMRSNPRKDTPFEADILGRLLDEVGVDRVKGAGGV